MSDPVSDRVLRRVLHARRAFLAHQERLDGTYAGVEGAGAPAAAPMLVVEDIADRLLTELLTEHAMELAGEADSLAHRVFEAEFIQAGPPPGVS